MPASPLLMIPGPIEVSPAVSRAYSVAPPSHVAPDLIEAFGRALARMRQVWQASDDSQPFIIPGSGTLAMDMACANLIEARDRVLVVNTGYFSDRIAEMLRRLGAEVTEVNALVGDAPGVAHVETVLDDNGPFKAMFVTHVDTSTGVRTDAEALARAARARGVLSVFDGVCATVGEKFAMEAWGADIYLTSSQKAIGLPVGLGLMVVSPAALAARAALSGKPPLSIDWQAWLPIMEAYEARRPSYFSTPATNLIVALDVALGEILDRGGPDEVAATHQRVGDAMRAAWGAMGLDIMPVRAALAANTLSAVRYPETVGPDLLGKIKSHGVVVAGGLYPGLKDAYFRVGHMGYVTTRPDLLLRTVGAIEQALAESGHAFPHNAGTEAARAALG